MFKTKTENLVTILSDVMWCYLEVSEFREGVHNDTEDDVESNGCEEHKEDHLVQH